jgi:outer membrane receptor protein involved in Fe transport
MHFFSLLATILMLPMLLLAENNDGDSTRTYVGREVVVTATRTPMNSADVPARVQTLSSDLLEQSITPTLADALRAVDGVYLLDYSTTGGMKNVMMRGFSASNITILHNGVPLNNPQYGSVDLSLIPLTNIERIEIVEGGASSLYGGNAPGGVINILTEHPTEQFYSKLETGGGSYGERVVSIKGGGKISNVGVVGSVKYESGADDFSYDVERPSLPDTTMRRQNTDYIRRHYSFSGEYQPHTNVQLYTTVDYLNFERGVPGSISFPTDDARQHDKALWSSLGGAITIPNVGAFNINGYYQNSKEGYCEPSMWGATDIQYKLENYGGIVQGEIPIVPWNKILIGGSIGLSTLDASGVSYGAPFIMDPQRTSSSLWLSDEIVLQQKRNAFDRFVLVISGRYEHYSDIEKGAFSPKLGVTARLLQACDMRLWGSISKNFRVPTFNDLYYPNYSNPDLKPEYSTSYEVGIRSSLDKKNVHSLQANYFFSKVKDKIVLNASWAPYNIGSAEHSGFEARYDYQAPENDVNAYVSISFVDALKTNKSSEADPTYKKKLPNVPLSSGVVGIAAKTIAGKISLQQMFTGVRYTNETNTAKLPAFAVTNISYSVEAPLHVVHCTLTATVRNIFDVQYQVVADYPMPGRTYHVVVGLEY